MAARGERRPIRFGSATPKTRTYGPRWGRCRQNPAENGVPK